MTNKPIVLNVPTFMSGAISQLLGVTEYTQPSLPFRREVKPQWVNIIAVSVFATGFTALFVLLAYQLGEYQVFSVPMFVASAIISVVVLFGFRQLRKSTRTIRVLITESTVTRSEFGIGYRNQWVVPLSDYRGIVYEVHKEQAMPGRPVAEVHYVILRHEDSQRSITLHVGRTTRFVNELLDGWSELLGVPRAIGNDLAAERLRMTTSQSLTFTFPNDGSVSVSDLV